MQLCASSVWQCTALCDRMNFNPEITMNFHCTCITGQGADMGRVFRQLCFTHTHTHAIGGKKSHRPVSHLGDRQALPFLEKAPANASCCRCPSCPVCVGVRGVALRLLDRPPREDVLFGGGVRIANGWQLHCWRLCVLCTIVGTHVLPSGQAP